MTKDLPKLLLKVPPPMGFQGQLSKEQLQKMGFPGEKMSPEGLEKFCKSLHIKRADSDSGQILLLRVVHVVS